MPKILLVEDNDLNQDMLSRRLRRRGFDVLIAIDGQEGIIKASSEQPDLILMDMSLPVMDGWQATQVIKADQKTASIPIIALTAHAMVGDREQALAAGCDDYDTKPIDLKRLLQKMATQLRITESIDSAGMITAKSDHSLVSHSAGRPEPSQQIATSIATVAPVEQQPSPSLSSSSSIAEHQRCDTVPLKLLFVSNVAVDRDMLSQYLERKQYEIVVANRSESALQTLATTDIALVLLDMDVMIPGIGGLDTLKLIRQSYGQAQLPVIITMASGASEDVIEVLELGANDYIPKPIDWPVAIARIQAHLKTRMAHKTVNQLLRQSTTTQTASSVWDGRYRLVEVLSKTALAQTVTAQDLRDPEHPLRLIHTFRLDTNNPDILQTAQEIFLAEMAALKQIQAHEQCLPLLSSFQEGEAFYIVHDYLEGTVLSQELQMSSQLSPKNICKLADALLTIIDFLHHSHMIHSHPHAGCFLQLTTGRRKLVLIDYGVSQRLLSQLSQKYPHQYQPGFQAQGDTLAPELREGNMSVRTDLYTIGKTLLKTLLEQDLRLDSPLGGLFNETFEIFKTMCEPQPEKRYPSAYSASRAVRNHWHKLWKVELASMSKQTNKM